MRETAWTFLLYPSMSNGAHVWRKKLFKRDKGEKREKKFKKGVAKRE